MSEFTADEMQELRELLEKEKIRKLKQLYSHLMDNGQIDALADIFTEDAVCEFGPEYGNWEGRETIRANYHGVFDMTGNAAEWVHDYYGSVGTLGGVAEVDPLGPEAGQFHTIRGSSWANGSITELRLSFRDFGAEPRDDVGFRIARYLGE